MPSHSDRRGPIARRLRALPCLLLATLLAGPAVGQSFDDELLREIERARQEEDSAAARLRAEQRAADDARASEARAAIEYEAEILRRREAELKGALEAELAVQSGLIDRGPTPDASASAALEDPSEGDPRIASRAPRARKLPASIFETSKVAVPAGEWGNEQTLELERRVLDADSDGKPEIIRWADLRSGEPVRQEEDRDLDGVVDAWSDYREGRLVQRVLDTDNDGKPDLWERYERERCVARDIDRNRDGVRDAFFVYAGDSLREERHDANDDGRIDLRIFYEKRRPVRAEEDRDRDGRMDQWTRYTVVGDRELVLQIDRDEKGRGTPDTFDHFQAEGGRAVLARREEDRDGDGAIDILSIYRQGRLFRREISDPELL